MKLKSLIGSVRDQILSVRASSKLKSDYGSIDINGLSLNSKLAKNDDLFFCLSGTRHKGSDFIAQAYRNGAIAVVTDEEVRSRIPKKLTVIKVKDVAESLGIIADRFYEHPLDKFNSIAVTGTNGKTSVTFIIENILKASKKQVGVIGTVNYRFARTKCIAKNTTPDVLTTHSTINKMLKNNIKYVLMEVSSHALAQRRVEGLKFDQAIFTNLSQDHFDYHKTKNKYFAVKSRLFTDHLIKGGVAIVNVDDAYGRKIVNLVKKSGRCNIITYAVSRKADINADSIMLNGDRSKFTLRFKDYSLKIDTNLIGLFNIYNILAAVASCLALGIPRSAIVKGIKNIYVPGRLETISSGNIKIIVDYAHTPDALKNVLLSLKSIRGKGRLIVVFGCGGNRDKDKRHRMGRVASALADFVIITSDNPRFEDPKKIITQIKKGIKNKDYIVLIDRRRAIEKAIEMARSGDIILIAGKGHEDYQIIRDKRIPFNDRKVIEDIFS
ncbi:UDP-N-acetylmuramoyl-L-alanyl-D-glutamate--2,6-diaminopimelate ligase [Candidatus Omnitrophota bacterium]